MRHCSTSSWPGLIPAIHVFPLRMADQAWMPGTRPGMTARLSNRRALDATSESKALVKVLLGGGLVPQGTRQRKEDAVLGCCRNGIYTERIALGERVQDLLDQYFRRRGAGGDAEPGDAFEHRPVEIGGAVDQHRALAAFVLGDLAQALRVRRVRRAHHDHGVDHGRDALDRKL